MRVIVQKAFSEFCVGTIIPEMPPNRARDLIARNLVRELIDSEGEEATFSSPVDRMMRTSQLQRRRAK